MKYKNHKREREIKEALEEYKDCFERYHDKYIAAKALAKRLRDASLEDKDTTEYKYSADLAFAKSIFDAEIEYALAIYVSIARKKHT